MGVNIAQGLNNQGGQKEELSFEKQIEMLKKKELVDDGILTQEEFDAKKREIMGL